MAPENRSSIYLRAIFFETPQKVTVVGPRAEDLEQRHVDLDERRWKLWQRRSALRQRHWGVEQRR
jgi:hypothetical protein